MDAKLMAKMSYLEVTGEKKTHSLDEGEEGMKLMKTYASVKNPVPATKHNL